LSLIKLRTCFNFSTDDIYCTGNSNVNIKVKVSNKALLCLVSCKLECSQGVGFKKRIYLFIYSVKNTILQFWLLFSCSWFLQPHHLCFSPFLDVWPKIHNIGLQLSILICLWP